MAYEFVYRHWVPATKEKEDFPFTYTLSAIDFKSLGFDTAEDYFETHKPDVTVELPINVKKTDLAKEAKLQKKAIKDALARRFDYAKYLNKYSEHFIKKTGISPKYTIKVIRYAMEVPEGRKTAVKVIKQIWALIAKDFKSEYQFNLITNINDLKNEIEGKDIIGFDTETTGLNPEVDHIVGVCFGVEPKVGYYVPIAHAKNVSYYNLGNEALDIVYNAMVNAKVTYMFNARFDMRMMEFSENKYDMLKVNVVDTQMTCHFADPEYRKWDLKSLEKHFLGYYRDDLFTTLKRSNLDDFNFSNISPENGLFYAAQDGISTYELGLETHKYLTEFGLSGQIDQAFLPILMRLENYQCRIDLKYLEESLNKMRPEIAKIEKQLASSIGDVNLNSPIQKQKLFESFGLDTGKRTKTGNMATGTDDILKMVERLEEEGKEYPEWLNLLDRLSKLKKQESTFYSSLYEQAKLTNGRVRFNYRVFRTATGRLASGADTGE